MVTDDQETWTSAFPLYHPVCYQTLRDEKSLATERNLTLILFRRWWSLSVLPQLMTIVSGKGGKEGRKEGRKEESKCNHVVMPDDCQRVSGRSISLTLKKDTNLCCINLLLCWLPLTFPRAGLRHFLQFVVTVLSVLCDTVLRGRYQLN